MTHYSKYGPCTVRSSGFNVEGYPVYYGDFDGLRKARCYSFVIETVELCEFDFTSTNGQTADSVLGALERSLVASDKALAAVAVSLAHHYLHDLAIQHPDEAEALCGFVDRYYLNDRGVGCISRMIKDWIYGK